MLESIAESQSKSDVARIDDTIPPANPPQVQIWARELKELSVELKRYELFFFISVLLVFGLYISYVIRVLSFIQKKSDMMQLKTSLNDIAQSLCQVQDAIRNPRS